MPEIRTVVLQEGEEIYSEEELGQAIQNEKEACIADCEKTKEKYTYLFAAVCDECIEAMRSRK